MFHGDELNWRMDYSIAEEHQTPTLGVSQVISPLRARAPRMDGNVSDPEGSDVALPTPPKSVLQDVSEPEASDMAFVTPPRSSPRLQKTRSTTKISWDLDGTSTKGGSGKTVWNERDTLDLIDAVKAVEDQHLLANRGRDVSKTAPKFKGDKWQQVAALLPNCRMSSNDRFPIICRGKFQELRRTYQNMLKGNTSRKFFSEEVCQKMKDFIDEVPSTRFMLECEDSMRSKLLENCSESPTSKNKYIYDLFSVEDSELGEKRGRNSDSDKPTETQGTVRRSSRIPKKFHRLESSSEDAVIDSAPESERSRGTRSSRTPSASTIASEGKLRVLRKRARLESPAEEAPKDDESHVNAISELFKKNFDLLRRNIDFSTEYHLHKHMHKHFVDFENRMTGLLQTIDQKIDKLDRKVDEKLEGLLPSQ